MAETIRGINVVIGGSVTGLDKALGDVKARSRDIQKELKEVQKLLKLDPRNTELLAQKQRLLAEAVAATRQKLDTLKAAQQQVNEQFAKGDISASQHRAFQRELAKTQAELKKYERDLRAAEKASSAFAQTLDAAHDRLERIGGSLTGLGKTLTTHVSAPIAAAAAGILALAGKAGALADELFDLADQTGLSTDVIQEWRHVATVAGVETDAVANAIMGLTRKMVEVRAGGGRASDMFRELGVRAEDASGNLRSSEAIFDDLVRALAAMENPFERNTIGAKLFGGAWKELAPILALGEEGIAAARKEAQDLGLVLDGEALQAANDFRIAMEKVKESIGAAADATGARIASILEGKLIPLLNERLVPLIQKVGDAIGDAIEWFGNLDPAMQNTILIAGGLVAALGPVVIVLGALAGALGAILSPVGLIVLGIAGLIAIGVALWANWDKIVAWLKELWARFSNWLSGIWESIKAKASAIGQGIAAPFVNAANWLTKKWSEFGDWWHSWWDGIGAWISGAVDTVLAPIQKIIDWVKEALAWLKELFTAEAEAPAEIGSAKRSSELPAAGTRPRLGTGGIVTRPIIAEIGEVPEAVIPLSRLGEMGTQVEVKIYNYGVDRATATAFADRTVAGLGNVLGQRMRDRLVVQPGV